MYKGNLFLSNDKVFYIGVKTILSKISHKIFYYSKKQCKFAMRNYL